MILQSWIHYSKLYYIQQQKKKKRFLTYLLYCFHRETLNQPIFIIILA